MRDWHAYVREQLALQADDRAREAEIVDELAQHLAACYEEALAAGLDERQAFATAAAELTNPAAAARDIRRTLSLPSLRHEHGSAFSRFAGDLLRDLRYAARSLRRAPGFSVVAILTLALGIGATTAIFSVVHGVLLAPLPFAHADRLVSVLVTSPSAGETYPFDDVDFLAWREMSHTFESIAGYSVNQYTVTGADAPEIVVGAAATDTFFTTLGVSPALGRVFRRGDGQPDAGKTVVLSYGFWQRHYGSDPSVLGHTLNVNRTPHIIVGVMPAGFTFPAPDISLWPIQTMQPTSPHPGPFYLQAIGRLEPHAGLDQARADLAAVAQAVQQRWPKHGTDWRFVPTPLKDSIVGSVRDMLYVLLAAVGLLLLIAMVNVANMLVTRASARERELAIRTALGAGRWRVVRQLLTESVLLALVAAGAGLALAWWGTRALLAIAPPNTPRLGDVHMNLPVLAFTLAAAVGCGILFGLLPAVRASVTRAIDGLRLGGRAGVARGARRLRQALVVTEIALALVLSIAAGLMIRSFTSLQHASAGFTADHVLTCLVPFPEAVAGTTDSGQVARTYQHLIDRVQEVPGVRAVAVSNSLPPDLLTETDTFRVEGQVLPPDEAGLSAPLIVVTPDYFQALGVPLLSGRAFDAHDTSTAPPVVIINEALARQFFPGVDPVGRRMKQGGPERPSFPWMTIVGVVADVKYEGLATSARPTFYEPFTQAPAFRQFLVVRTSRDPASIVPDVRAAVASIDPDIAVAEVRTADQLLEGAVGLPRFRTLLVGVFAGIGLLLAAIGVYGVMAYVVAERTHELGVRLALGATRKDVRRMVLGEALRLSILGVALGLVGAMAVTRLLKNLLFGVSATDGLTFALVAVVLIATALVASNVPARRATRIDPMVALRDE